jgi:hypothetical protein
MARPEQTLSSVECRPTDFATTHWSVVLHAGDAQSPSVTAALEQLCQSYWYPLYAYVRRQGHSPEDAQDLTQAFFARFLEKDYVRRANPDRGRFHLAIGKQSCSITPAGDSVLLNLMAGLPAVVLSMTRIRVWEFNSSERDRNARGYSRSHP